MGATVEDLASHFEVLLYHQDVKALAAPAIVLIDPFMMVQELKTILDTQYWGAASTELCPATSHFLCHLPLPALNMLVPWVQMLP